MAEEKSFTSILRVVNDYDDDNNNGFEVLYLYLLGIRFEKIIKTYRLIIFSKRMPNR